MKKNVDKITHPSDVVARFVEYMYVLASERWKDISAVFSIGLNIHRFYGIVFPARRRMFTLFISLLLVFSYIGYTLQYISSFQENIPFQVDLRLQEKDVFIEGELDAYRNLHTNYTVDCDALRNRKKKEDDFVYVSVITSQKTLKTLGKAVYNTWGMEVDRIDFYVGNAPVSTCECEQCKDMSVIKLDVVRDDLYPPQQKAFRAMEHVCNNFLDKYKWFIRADDDGYFKFANLRHMLKTLDENRFYVLGKPTAGSVLSYRYLQIHGYNYCDGSAVIYSRAALKAFCPYLRRCSEECVTHHEDVEIGRCMIQHFGVQCAQSSHPLVMKELFLHKPLEKRNAFDGNLDEKSFMPKAIHMHKVIKESVMHNLHAYYLRGQEAMAEKCGLIKKEESRKKYLLEAIQGVENPTQQAAKPQEVVKAS